MAPITISSTTIESISKKRRSPNNDSTGNTFLLKLVSLSNQKQTMILTTFVVTCWIAINVVFTRDGDWNTSDDGGGKIKYGGNGNVNGGSGGSIVSLRVHEDDDDGDIPVDDDEPFLLQPPGLSDEDIFFNHLVDETSRFDVDFLQDDEFTFSGGGFRRTDILARVSDVTSSPILADVKSAQNKAFKWIVAEDARQVKSDDPDLLQRYVLAVMFYSLKGENWHHGDLHWLSGVHECYWSKKYKRRVLGVVECDRHKKITRIELAESNLQGTLPSEIGALSELKSLDLQNNRLLGHIPPHIGNLSRLETLTMNGNNLSGSIPPELGQLTLTTELLIHFNELEGAVPQTVCQLRKEKSLWNLWTDCASTLPPLFCNCCTVCCNGLSSCAPP